MEKVASIAKDSANWASNGFPMTTPEKLDLRMATCKRCELWDQSGFGGTGSCKECGCAMQLKLRLATSKCPIDKW